MEKDAIQLLIDKKGKGSGTRNPVTPIQNEVFNVTPDFVEKINRESGATFSINPKDIQRYNSYDAAIVKAAKEKGEDPNLIKFLMMQESRMRPGQTSPAGYYGLSQTNKATLETLNKNFGTDYKLSDMDDPEKAANMMADYIKFSKRHGAKEWDDFIVSYNRGVGHIKTHQEGGEHPVETQKYVKIGQTVKDSLGEEDPLMKLIQKRKAEKEQGENAQLSFQQEEKQMSFFDETVKKYKTDPRLKNVANATGVSDKVIGEVQKAWMSIPKKNGGQFRYDTVNMRINGFTEMFPELAEEAKQIQQELSAAKGDLAVKAAEEKMAELESKVSGQMQFAPGAMTSSGFRTNAHPNWQRYEDEIINNPAVSATKNILGNTENLKRVIAIETGRDEGFWTSAMLNRFLTGVASGVKDEAKSYMTLPETVENNLYIRSLVNKIKEAEKNQDDDFELTTEEAHLLMALVENSDLQMQIDPKRFTAYNWGHALGSNLSFMAEFYLTGGLRSASEIALKRYLTKGAMLRAASETIPVNIAARLASVGVQSTYMPRMYKNFALNVSNGEPVGEAFMNAWYENFNEVFSENIAVGKLVDVASPSAYQQTLRRMGSALAGRKGIKGISRAFLEEYLEEKYAEIGMYAYRPGDFKEFAKEFFDLKSNGFTAGSVATMTAVLGAPSMINEARTSIKYAQELNRVKKLIPSEIRENIDIVLQNQDATIAEQYGMVFDLINDAVQNNKLEGDIATGAANAMRYAVAKTRNIVLQNFAKETIGEYRDMRRVAEGLPVYLEEDLRDALKEEGIEIGRDESLTNLIDRPAFLKSEETRTPEEKTLVEGTTKAIKSFFEKNKERIESERGRRAVREQTELRRMIEFNNERATLIEEELGIAQGRINELNQKGELTVEDKEELADLETFVAESQKMLSETATSTKEFEKKLAEIKSQKPDLEESSQQETVEKLPKSKTEVEGELQKKETLDAEKKKPIGETAPAEKEAEAAKKAKISPKNFADLVRAGKELFGLSESKAYASAVVMDLLIRNQAKREGISVQEMYDRYEFRKTDTKSLEEAIKDETIKEQLRKGKLSPAGAFFTEDGKLIVNAITNPNVSTPMHEMAHAFEGHLTETERKVVLNFAKAEKWDKTVSEKFAIGFERYLQEGKAPSTELQKIFDQFRDWLIEIYNALSPFGIRLNPEMRKVYDAMLGAEQKVDPKKETPKVEAKEQPSPEAKKTKALSEFNPGDYILNVNNNKEYELIDKSKTSQKVRLRPVGTNFQEIHDSDAGGFILKPINNKGLSKRGEALFQIIGENANLKDNVRNALERAKQREILGNTPMQIKQTTGWERGVDGKWRYEIPDIEFRYNNKRDAAFFEQGDEVRIGDIFKEDGQPLFEAYPQLTFIRLVNKKLSGLASYDVNENVINIDLRKLKKPEEEQSAEDFLGSYNLEEVRLTIIHELQHAIQQIEKFPQGASPKSIAGKILDIAQRYERGKNLKIVNWGDRWIIRDTTNFHNSWGNFKSEEEAKRHISENYKEPSDGLKKIANKLKEGEITKDKAYEAYRKVAGEVEARNAAYRSQFYPQITWMKTLAETEDVARDEQIILFQGGEQDAKETRASTPESRKAEGAQRQEDERIRLRQPQKDRVETAPEEGEVRFQTLPPTIDVDGVKRPTANSQGKQIHPTEEGVRNFWKWFGESKVVDEQGRPLVVYRGTNTEILGKNPKRPEEAYYFAKNADYAATFADNNTGSIIPAYLKLNNPFYSESIGDVTVYKFTTFPEYNESYKLSDGLYGLDANTNEPVYVVFSPSQIKSATGNLGTFSPETANILFQTPQQYNLSSLFPKQTDAKKQKTQDGILKRLQGELEDTIRYMTSVISKQPDNAVFVNYNGKTYSVIETKVGGKKGFSVRLIEQKGTSAKGLMVGKGYIRDNVLSAFENESNRMSKEDALNMVVSYLNEEFRNRAEDAIAKKVNKEKPVKREALEFKPISSVDDLIDRIKIEANAVKEFQKVIGTIYKMLKESAIKKYITAGEYISIDRRLATARNYRQLMDVVRYTEEILGKAGHRKQVSIAKKFVDDFYSNREKVGTGEKHVKIIVAAKDKLSDMSYEDLLFFNSIAQEVDIKSLNPRVWPLARLSNMLNMIKESEKEEREPTSFEDIENQIADLKEALSDKTTEKDRKFFVGAMRKLNRLRRAAYALLNEANIAYVSAESGFDSKQLRQILDDLGILETMTIEGGNLEKELNEEKLNYFDSIVNTLRTMTQQLNDVVDRLDPNLAAPLLRLLNVTRDDLNMLNLAEVEAFDRFIFNLANGHLTPFGAMIEERIGRNRMRTQILDQFFANVAKSKQWNAFTKKAEKEKNFQSELQKKIFSTQSHRIDTWLGNYDKDNTIGSVYNFIGRGISKESITSAKYEKIISDSFRALVEAYSTSKGGYIFRQGKVRKKAMEQKLAWIGMVLVEKSYRAMDGYSEETASEETASMMFNNYGIRINEDGEINDKDFKRVAEMRSHEDRKPLFDENKGHYRDLMNFLKANGATKVIAGVEVMDADKAEALLRKEAPVARYMDSINEVLTEMKGMAEWSTYANGRSFKGLENYFPFIVIKKGRPMEPDKIRQSMNFGRVPITMQAGATVERTGAVNYVSINPNTVMKGYIRSIARNYHVYGEIKKAVGAVIDAGTAAHKAQISDKKDSYMTNLTKAIVGDIKLRLDKIYRVNSFTPRKNELAKILKPIKIGLLAKWHRPPAELGANVPRAVVSIKGLPIGVIVHARSYSDIYQGMIEDYIGERYMSRWGEDIRGKTFENKTLAMLERGAKRIVTWADTTVGRPLFVSEFLKQFKKLTGAEFNVELYRDDARYRIENERVIEKSAVRGVRKVEELFNDKAPMTAPAFISFLNGLIDPKRADSYWGQVGGFLMSFSRNEQAQLVTSLNRIRYSDVEGDDWQGVRDIAAIVISNVFYGILRHAAMVGLDILARSIIGDDEEDPWLKERVDAIKTWHFYKKKFMGSIGELALGGNAQVAFYVYRWLMLVADRWEWGKDETRDVVKTFMTQEMYVKHIPPQGGGTKNVLEAAVPLPSVLVGELFTAIDDMGDVVSFTDTLFGLDIIHREVTDEEARDAAINLFLTGLKYGMPNPVSPTIESLFEKDRRRKSYDNKKKGKPDSGKEEFINAFKNAGDLKLINKEIDEMKKAQEILGIK